MHHFSISRAGRAATISGSRINAKIFFGWQKTEKNETATSVQKETGIDQITA